MGEASSRGNYEERRDQAVIENAEAIICLRDEGGSLNMAAIVRNPDQDNAAVIFASFVNSNLPELLKQAMSAYKASKSALPIVTDVTSRIIGADGPATGEVRILAADGSTLQ